jgi:thioesterase domain-containing protein
MRLILDEAAVLSSSEMLRYFARCITQKVKSEIVQLQAAGSDLLQSIYNALNHGSEVIADRLEPIRSPVGRMLVRAQSKYMPRAYPGRISLFLVAVSDDGQLAPDRGWSELAEGGVEIHEIPGWHQTIFESRHLPVLAEELDACLRAAFDRRECQGRDDFHGGGSLIRTA